MEKKNVEEYPFEMIGNQFKHEGVKFDRGNTSFDKENCFRVGKIV